MRELVWFDDSPVRAPDLCRLQDRAGDRGVDAVVVARRQRPVDPGPAAETLAVKAVV